MAYDLHSIKNSDDFLDVLDGTLQSWLDIRRDIDSTSYMHKDLLQRARTLVPRVTSDKASKIISSIDAASINANISDLENPQSLRIAPTEEHEVDTIQLDNAETMSYSSP